MVIEFIKCGVPFAFTRYGDGEYHLIQGMELGDNTQAKEVDRWSWKGGVGRLGRDMREAFAHRFTEIVYFQGFPQPNSEYDHILRYYVNATTQPTQYLSSALLWIGPNWERTYNLFTNFLTIGKSDLPIIPIINEDALGRHDILLKWCKDVIYFPDDGPNWWEKEGQRATRYYENIARAYDNVLFMVALGPVSEAVIYRMAVANPNNQYIDFGSAMEKWTKGESTRNHAFGEKEWGGWEFRKNETTGRCEKMLDLNGANKLL